MGISDEGVRLTLRLPEALRDQLLRRARLHTRSMNSEIIATLESALTFGNDYAGTPKQIADGELTGPCLEEMSSLCRKLPSEQARLLLALMRSMVG